MGRPELFDGTDPEKKSLIPQIIPFRLFHDIVFGSEITDRASDLQSAERISRKHPFGTVERGPRMNKTKGKSPAEGDIPRQGKQTKSFRRGKLPDPYHLACGKEMIAFRHGDPVFPPHEGRDPEDWIPTTAIGASASIPVSAGT